MITGEQSTLLECRSGRFSRGLGGGRRRGFSRRGRSRRSGSEGRASIGAGAPIDTTARSTPSAVTTAIPVTATSTTIVPVATILARIDLNRHAGDLSLLGGNDCLLRFLLLRQLLSLKDGVGNAR